MLVGSAQSEHLTHTSSPFGFSSKTEVLLPRLADLAGLNGSSRTCRERVRNAGRVSRRVSIYSPARASNAVSRHHHDKDRQDGGVREE